MNGVCAGGDARDADGFRGRVTARRKDEKRSETGSLDDRGSPASRVCSQEVIVAVEAEIGLAVWS